MFELFNSYWSDEAGQGLTEYALIIALVSIGLLLVLTAFRDEIGAVFNNITTELRGVGPNQVPAP